MYEENQAWLLLWRTPGIGSRTFSHLLSVVGAPTEVLLGTPADWRQWGLSQRSINYLTNPDLLSIDKDLSWLQGAANRHLIKITDPQYPAQLKQIYDPPPLLFLTGNPAILHLPQIAIVGSRTPSPQGRENALMFSQALSAAGLVVTSGLAVGIDTCAHQGAIGESQLTVAVLATGPEQVYPRENRELAAEIAAKGALLTEFPVGTPPLAEHFPRRNRIVSGLSLGVLVVEAALRSGSLITARLALEQGREVLSVPGSIHNPKSRGCHQLLRQGAHLVETCEDVLYGLNIDIKQYLNRFMTEQEAPQPDALVDQNLLNSMGFDPVSIDQLVARSGLTSAEVSSMLLTLEMEGRVQASLGGIYTRVVKGEK